MPNVEVRGFGIGPIGIIRGLSMAKKVRQALTNTADLQVRKIGQEAITDVIPSSARFCKDGKRAPYLRINNTSGKEENDMILLALSRAGIGLDCEIAHLKDFIEGEKVLRIIEGH